MFLLWHPWLTTTNLSYSFPLLETSATASCGTTGICWRPVPCWFRFFSCAFRLQAGQVTQHDKWHAWSGDTACLHTNVHPSGCLVTCFPSNVGGLFSFPTHSFFLVSLPFYTAQVCLWTSVHLNIGQVSLKYRTGVLIQVYSIYYKHAACFSSFTLVY